MEKQKGSNPDKTYPYMLDGMTMYLASGDKNKPKAAKKSHDVAYWEDNLSKSNPAVLPYAKKGLTNSSSEDIPENPTIKRSWDFVPQPQFYKNDISDSKESSKTDKYSLWDAFVDFLPFPSSDNYNDLYTDFKNKDFQSAIHDISRIIAPFGPDKITKTGARYIWKLGADLYLRGVEGYNVSADLLEHSLQEKPKDLVFYDNSEIANTIKKDTSFLTQVDSVVDKIENNKTITSADKSHSFNDGDLYYSIHGCNFEIEDIKYNKDGTKDISIHISDTYDYTKIWTTMDETTGEFKPSRISLGTVANDAGTVSTWFDAINPYEVDVYLTVRR